MSPLETRMLENTKTKNKKRAYPRESDINYAADQKKSSENDRIPVLMDKIKCDVICTTLSEKPLLSATLELFEKHLKDNSMWVRFCLFSQIDTCGLLHLKWKVLRQS